MKPFNLEEAKAGKPVVTRDGRPVRILAFDRKGDKPIVGLVTSRELEISYYWFEDGKEATALSTECELFMKSEKTEGWVNVYRAYGEQDVRRVGGIFDTEHKALHAGSVSSDYITTIKVEWEE